MREPRRRFCPVGVPSFALYRAAVSADLTRQLPGREVRRAAWYLRSSWGKPKGLGGRAQRPLHFVIDLHLICTYIRAMDLTEKQQAVFDFLKVYRSKHGRPPSYEEIRREFGFASLNSVRKHLQQLDKKGFIRTPWGNQKRALEILPEHEDRAAAVSLHMVMKIAKDRPFEAPIGPATVYRPEVLLGRGE